MFITNEILDLLVGFVDNTGKTKAVVNEINLYTKLVLNEIKLYLLNK